MKYIKKFNESNSFYSSINPAEMEDLNLHKRDIFSDNEVKYFNKLDNFFLELHYFIKGNKKVGVKTIQLSDRQYGPPNIKIFISKYEDEWYGIEYYKSVSLRYKIESYKCDQFDGVIRFLKDKKVIV